jgi:Ca-activated chloride channel family protein
MLDRLFRIPVADDEALDAAVRDVPVPLHLRARLERIGRSRIRWARLRQTAIAASLFVAIGTCYLGAMLAFLFALRRSPGPPLPRLISRVSVEVSPTWDSEPPGPDAVRVVVVDDLLVVEPPIGMAPAPGPPRPEFQLAAYRRPVGSRSGPMRDLFAGLVDPSRRDPLEHRARSGLPVLTVARGRRELEALSPAGGSIGRGVRIPPVEGVDVAFLMQTGFNPFVSPAAHPELRSSIVPLGVPTGAYDLTEQLARSGRRVSGDALRTEDFLAAIDCQFPQPDRGALGLHIAGGPSPFSTGSAFPSPEDRRLLLVGVQARKDAVEAHPPTHLTVAVDVSAGMRASERLAMVSRALGNPQGWMGPKDRVSLVTFNQNAYVLVEDIGRGVTDQLHAAIRSLSAEGSLENVGHVSNGPAFFGKSPRSNPAAHHPQLLQRASKRSADIAAGLRHAYAVAYHQLGQHKGPNRVVLLTDSLAPRDPRALSQLADRLAEPVVRGITLDVLYLGDAGGDTERGLANLARLGGGRLHQATSADRVHGALREVVTGRSHWAARDVRLEVTFNPRSVAAYRVLGHEVGQTPAEPSANFRAGQSGVALYEVQLRPGPEKEVCVVEVTWRDPVTGQFDSASRQFRRGQFADDMKKAPLSLQAAAVVAGAVEVLRGSPFVAPRPSPRSLVSVLERASHGNPRVRQLPAFVQIIQLVEQVESAGPPKRRAVFTRATPR